MSVARTALDELDESGSFKRTEAGWRNWIKKESQFPPEANRYHLYVSYACPWASRCVAALYMKGLQDVIGLSVTHPTWQYTRPGQDEHAGWMFVNPNDPPVKNLTGMGSFDCKDCIPDTVNGYKFIRDLYEAAGDTIGKYSVPVLWDKKTHTIVSNESSDILRMLNSEFQEYAKNPKIDLYPEDLRKTIDEVNAWIYPAINDGVYRCGFATKQGAYNEAFDALFEALDKVEAILTKQRFLAGDVITEADIRLFVTLIRFDPVYVVYFKTNKKCMREYPALADYVRDIYQTPGVKESVNIHHITTHYFTSHPKLNTYAIIPKGPHPWWEEAHGRNKLNKKPLAWTI